MDKIPHNGIFLTNLVLNCVKLRSFSAFNFVLRRIVGNSG